MCINASDFDLTNSIYGIRATDETLKKPSKEIPSSLNNGSIPTLNQTGFMTPESDEFSDDFIESAAGWAKRSLPVLDIGAAYGITTIPALEKGGIVIANDIEEEHLLHLKEKTPPLLRHNLYLNYNRFPETLDFPDQSFGSILMRRIVHFLTPAQMEKALDNANRWLVPNGVLYIITMSPYHYSLGSFLNTYDERWNANNTWPGEIENMKTYVPHLAQDIPEYLHVMDERPFINALSKRNFDIVISKLFGFARSCSKDPKGVGYYGIKAIKRIVK